jgi:N-acetylneuraminic acid mutarotase
MQTPFYRLALAAASGVLFTTLTALSCHKTGLPDVQDGNWLDAAPIGSYPRSSASCFVIGDSAYIGLGYNETVGGLGRLADFWRFCLDSGWQQVADFPGHARSNAVGFSLGNYGYVGTGYDGVNPYSDFYQYDPLHNQWIPKASFPGVARYDATGFGLLGKGYIGTGFSIYWLSDFYQYDPITDTWARTAGTAGPFSKRRGAVSFVYNNRAYIVTGSSSGGMVKDFWSFDPSQPDPWLQLRDIVNTNNGSFDDGYTDIERQNAVAFVNGAQAFLTTGQNGSLLSSTWRYDFVNDLWSRRTPFPRTPRFGAVAFTIHGESFVGTGNTGNSTLDDFLQFIPDKPYIPND